MRYHHIALPILLAAWPSVSWCAEADVKMYDELSLVVRRPNVGTLVARADIDARQVDPGLMAQVVRHAIAGAIGVCGEVSKARMAVTALPSADFIGGSITRLSGVGMYVNIAKTADHSSGTGSVSPFVSVLVDIGSPVSRTVEIRDYERVELFDAEKFDPARMPTAQLQKVLVPYAERVIAKALVANVCAK